MSSKDHLNETLEYYRQQRTVKLDELRAIEIMVRHLEKELGESSDSNSELVPPQSLSIPESMGGARTVRIQPDEFFGMSQSEAAKAYLKKVRKAVSLDQVVEALNDGGAKVGGVDPKKTLYVSLARNPLREFVIPREGYIGLREFYPNLPKAKPPNGKTKKSRKSAKKRKSSKKQNTASKAKPPDSGVKTRVRQFLGDKQAHSVEDIVKDAEAQLGQSVKKIEILGILKSKDFVREDGKYRMTK